MKCRCLPLSLALLITFTAEVAGAGERDLSDHPDEQTGSRALGLPCSV